MKVMLLNALDGLRAVSSSDVVGAGERIQAISEKLAAADALLQRAGGSRSLPTADYQRLDRERNTLSAELDTHLAKLDAISAAQNDAQLRTWLATTDALAIRVDTFHASVRAATGEESRARIIKFAVWTAAAVVVLGGGAALIVAYSRKKKRKK